MRVEGLYSSFSPSFEPLTYPPLADSQCDRNVFLLPAFLFQLPCSFSSFFSPIGSSTVLPYFLFYHTLLLPADISKSASNDGHSLSRITLHKDTNKPA